MKRDAFDPSVGDIAGYRRSGTLPASELLASQAHASWLTSLRVNGNHPSPDH